MPYTYYTCNVVDILTETPQVRRFVLKYPDEIQLNFTAGQFIMLNLPIESKITNRSYSIASEPNNDNLLELIIVVNPSGLGTPFLFNEVEIGSEIQATLPIGKFKLDDDLSRDICFVCTGTGIAPFRSMIRDVIRRKIPFKSMTLIMGARFENDLLYHEEFLALQKNEHRFQYHPVLSRQQWEGYTGYVHKVYLEKFPEKSNTLFYLCGWSDMIKQSRDLLLQCVHDKKQIRYESYD
jgi:CDP-4-dehydro-6-deoxyglucose reductase